MNVPNYKGRKSGGLPGGVGADFVLHPLIHNSSGFAQAQDVEKKNAEPKTPHFLSVNQDILARSQKAKWGVCNPHSCLL